MNNTRTWRNNAEVVEGFRSPLKELESFSVAVELKLFILFSGIGSTSNINLDGVINNQVNRAEWVNP